MHLTKNSHAFSCRCIQIVGNKNRKVETEMKPHVLVKQASDRCIIDPAGTSHEHQGAEILRKVTSFRSWKTPQLSGDIMVE